MILTLPMAEVSTGDVVLQVGAHRYDGGGDCALVVHTTTARGATALSLGRSVLAAWHPAPGPGGELGCSWWCEPGQPAPEFGVLRHPQPSPVSGP